MSKVSINEATLTAIGAAIREKTGKSELIAPGTMPEEIRGIVTSGDGPTDEELTLSGNMEYAFTYNKWNWLIEKYGNRITTKDITNLYYTFSNCDQIETIPFEINIDNSNKVNIGSLFASCRKLKNLPKINDLKISSLNSTFQYCNNLREIPEDYCDTWDWSIYESSTSSSEGSGNRLFYDCCSLRKFPIDLISHVNKNTPYYSNSYYSAFESCYALDEIDGLAVYPQKITSNFFSSTLNHCNRLKNFTFAPYEGSVDWTNQTINLTYNVGYVDYFYINRITDYNSGITADKEVKDDATYQALKNDPDWFATKIDYSRYNHDSAVNTINSLPTTTGTGCTIKFRGASGSLTDGGAINTLTEEEIAVAAAKGWVVALT